MMKTLGAAIIGCGWVAEEYVKTFENDERLQVQALVSRNRANAQRYRDRWMPWNDRQILQETNVTHSQTCHTS